MFKRNRMLNFIDKMRAVILAGGRGTRMGNITLDVQKCLLPVDGEPALLHVMRGLVEAFGKVDATFCIAYRSEDVTEFVSRNRPIGLEADFIVDMGDSRYIPILNSMRESLQNEPFICLPGNVVTLPEAYALNLEGFVSDNVPATLLLSPKLNEVDTHAIGRLRANRVIDFIYAPSNNIPKGYLRDMDIRVADKRIFTLIDSNREITDFTLLFQQALKEGYEIGGVTYRKQWVHLGYPEDLRKTIRGR